ncbi:GTPase-associated system all-helical protein GASH [Nannocystis pusilla]|uniref:GTPase-associated system all-helical protein GASH n=1 Tax=Nannocystis pusilla TaxID=889268 RepID=A0A9X3EKR0_9BACT|nr:GTPase-associated system all-helical protein GASH [Nannocystis pusilla]MCY1005807.1 GTPase-associated system all-helical protein GASH [Nannocystis pusilla]
MKIEKAAVTVAEQLRAKPPLLIEAILAALDPEVSDTDPAVARAEQALIAEWKAMRSIHINSPVGLLRAILLDACSRAAEGRNAAILWLTAADTLPHARLGREEAAARRMLEMLAQRTEQAALARPMMPAEPRPVSLSPTKASMAVSAPTQVEREHLLQRVAATVHPNYRNNGLPNPNQFVPSQNPQHWSWEFADRMNALLADELDRLGAAFAQSQTQLATRMQSLEADVLKALGDMLIEQQRWVHDAFTASEARKQAEELRLNALWWSEALYSPSLRRGYRELPVPIAAVAMAVDLLDQVTKPAPASVVYLLAETVQRLRVPASSTGSRSPKFSRHCGLHAGKFPRPGSLGWAACRKWAVSASAISCCRLSRTATGTSTKAPSERAYAAMSR